MTLSWDESFIFAATGTPKSTHEELVEVSLCVCILNAKIGGVKAPLWLRSHTRLGCGEPLRPNFLPKGLAKPSTPSILQLLFTSVIALNLNSFWQTDADRQALSSTVVELKAFPAYRLYLFRLISVALISELYLFPLHERQLSSWTIKLS